jgi:uncharacterized membrane protein
MSPLALLVGHAAATWFMTGVIWIVQVVHYPLFSYADRATYSGFADAHGRLITLIVGPAMLVELVTALLLLADRPTALSARAAWAGVALIGVIWASTVFLQVPMHGQLAQGYDARAHAWLVGTNWIRTIAWTARSLLVGWVVLRALQSAS